MASIFLLHQYDFLSGLASQGTCFPTVEALNLDLTLLILILERLHCRYHWNFRRNSCPIPTDVGFTWSSIRHRSDESKCTILTCCSDDVRFQVLQKADDSTLKLVNIDDNKKKGVAPAICLKMVLSPVFTTMVMIIVLANTTFTATISHTHNVEIDARNRELYHKIEVSMCSFPAKDFWHDSLQTLFTMFFDLEAIFKIFALGFKNYIRRSIFKFEFMLAVGTTIHCFPMFYRSPFTYFQVLRVARLLKSSPLLENFLNKVLLESKF